MWKQRHCKWPKIIMVVPVRKKQAEFINIGFYMQLKMLQNSFTHEYDSLFE